MRWLRSLLVALLAAGITAFGAWLVMLWSDAVAPSLVQFEQRHPASGVAFGALSCLVVLMSALWQWRHHKSR